MSISDEQLAEQAKQGSSQALEELVRRFQDRVYGLALRMLYHPSDAEDASQEILIKVVTKLDGFRGEGSLAAWIYRVAANHLLTARRTRWEKSMLPLDTVRDYMDRFEAEHWRESESAAHTVLMVEEARVSCLHHLLLALGRDQRLALILGIIFQFNSTEGGWIMGIKPAAFRKRMSRARERIKDFLCARCGLMDQGNPCSCKGSITPRVVAGWMKPDQQTFARLPRKAGGDGDGDGYVREFDEMCRMTALYRSVPEYIAPGDFAARLKEIITPA